MYTDLEITTLYMNGLSTNIVAKLSGPNWLHARIDDCLSRQRDIPHNKPDKTAVLSLITSLISLNNTLLRPKNIM